jgi:UDP-N-acetyl-D-glucosamine dehydrogenase
MSKVGIIGQGYVGSALSWAAAKAGHTVIGFDVNQILVNDLNSKKTENYIATSDPKELKDCSVLIIAVPTPLTKDKLPDLSYIEKAIKMITENIDSPILIINESTSYPGTLRNLIARKIFEQSGVNHFYAASPERVDPGNIKWDMSNTPRLVAGLSSEGTKQAVSFYSTFCNNVISVSSAEVAETAKLFENTFRQVNIALVNELAQICHLLEIDSREVIKSAGTKPFGFMEFSPGAGVGGHCIPIDPLYLSYVAAQNGVEVKFVKLADQINRSMPRYVVERVLKDFKGDLKFKKVVVIGLAYKPNISDTRESVAIDVIELLRAERAIVSWHDDFVLDWNGEKSSNLNGFDIAIVVTRHSNLDLESLSKISYVFDCTGSIQSAHQI